MPLRAHPLAAVCVAASGGWAPVQGARGKANQPLCIHARTNWLVRQWALLHGPARAGPRWVPGGQELDRGKAIAHGSVLNDA